jgi:hypothetical protein
MSWEMPSYYIKHMVKPHISTMIIFYICIYITNKFVYVKVLTSNIAIATLQAQ